MAPGHPDNRWTSRSRTAGLVDVLAALIPPAGGVAAALAFVWLVPAPRSWTARAGVGLGSLAVSAATVLILWRASRRLAPLAVLLRLSIGFPDRVPSRLGLALRAGSPRRLLADAHSGTGSTGDAAARVLALAASLTAHDRATRGHSERVRAYAEMIADELDMPEADHDRMRWAALLHDVGKLAVPAATLNAARPLTDTERALIIAHPSEGARLAAPLAEWLGSWASIIEQHHERWDGQGYPNGVKGEDLSLGSRIVCVADSYDAMTFPRSYSRPLDPAVARAELVSKAGTQFDPRVVRAFLNISLGRLRAVAGLVGLAAAMPALAVLGRRLRDAGQVYGLAAAAVTAVVATATGGGAPGAPHPVPSATGLPATAGARAGAANQAPPLGSPPSGSPGTAAALPGGAGPGESGASTAPASVAAPVTHRHHRPGRRPNGNGGTTGRRPDASPGLPCQLQVSPALCAGADASHSGAGTTLTVHARARPLPDVTVRHRVG